ITAAMHRLISIALLFLGASLAASLFLPDSLELRQIMQRYQDELEPNSTKADAPLRTRRAIGWSDREEILQLHNKLRGEVYPTASNMEYMVWDDELEKSATYWAEQCQWEHGPKDLLMSIGQNLAVHWGRYRSPAYHVQAWYDEVKDYTYPYPHECNPWCPERCSGPMCTHYTQVVWATTNRVGCAVHLCPRMNVWGEIWENSVYLVCNYSPKGNWIGEAPYQHGRPCSQCPPSYGGSCRDNLCYKGDPERHEPPDTNEVEKQQEPVQPRTTPTKPQPKPSSPKKPANANPSSTKTTRTTYLAQNIKCETRMRDKCKGATCNRSVVGNIQSSICRAAIHYGIIDNNGGLVDVTRKDNFPFFVKATKNGVESFSKYKPGNAFTVSRVEEQTIDCYTTVAEICPFKSSASHCPRVFCPANCINEPSYWAPVVGTNIYGDVSTCFGPRASLQVVNCLLIVFFLFFSYSKSNTVGGSFRVFAVRE
uniref:Cysteine-rich secretory protein LCCL domain-containing 2-like n=1 Tax=Sinocyclocheilus rhinocerous TaxID=307959 RepID=A0A673J6W8_9TELE